MRAFALPLVAAALMQGGLAQAQSEYEKQQNLSTCLSGRYPILCKRHWLTSEQLKSADAAERQQNLITCLAGKYPTLCKREGLTQEELRQVIAAERRANLQTCMNTRYKALCKKELLTEDELSRVLSAERAEADRQAARDQRQCATGHWVQSVSGDGQIVRLEDGSAWQVNAADAVTTALWLPTTDVIACDDRLINTDNNEAVGAMRVH